MEALLYFAVWAAAVFVMMRFGCGAHVMGQRHSGADRPGETEPGQLRWIPPQKDVDPVCGKEVRTDNAKPSVYEGTVYYFCTRDCREVFEAAPDQYVTRSLIPDQSRLEHSHA